MINYAVFILTHKRPDNQITYRMLKNKKYTGKIYLIIDSSDPTKEKYIEKYKDEVIVFDKNLYKGKFDVGDNFDSMRGVIYARNASFDIAETLGLDYFIVLDDDYNKFDYRFDDNFYFKSKVIYNFDILFESLLEFYISTNILTLATLQGGDFIGQRKYSKIDIELSRKAMNLFVCSPKRKYLFVGRINEDVNMYCTLGSIGKIIFSTNQVCLCQQETQKNKGGMTELYLDEGTYIKSFYSVIYSPSSVKIDMMGDTFYRLHHSVSWKNTVPAIISETVKKYA